MGHVFHGGSRFGEGGEPFVDLGYCPCSERCGCEYRRGCRVVVVGGVFLSESGAQTQGIEC